VATGSSPTGGSLSPSISLEADTLRSVEAFDVTVVASHRVDRKSRVSARLRIRCQRYVSRRVDVASVPTPSRSSMVPPSWPVTLRLKGDEVLVLTCLEVLAIETGAFPVPPRSLEALIGVFGSAHEVVLDRSPSPSR
jgi:hypothetical protein